MPLSIPTISLNIAPEEADRSLNEETINLAMEDVHRVIQQQTERNQTLTTKLNILFVTNGALLTSLTLSRLVLQPNLFTITQLIGFFVNFTLLINAFLPRQVIVTPNLEDRKVFEPYLTMSPQQYQLQMLSNHLESYRMNKQRIDDTSQSLYYAALVTWFLAFAILLELVFINYWPN